MKLFVACVVSLVVLNFVSAKPAEEKYTTKYDNIDYKNILNSNRLLANYMKCLLEGKGCTPAGKEMRGKFFQVLYWNKFFDKTIHCSCSIFARCSKNRLRQVQ